MRYVFTSKQMIDAEKHAIQHLGIPDIVLMERAALGVYEQLYAIADEYKKNIMVVCGKGNNGADGYAIARILFLNGYNVSVYCMENPSKGTLANTQLEIVKKLGINIEMSYDFTKYTMIIDAIFGTGFNRILDEKAGEIINFINDSDAYVVSVDIPSGLSGSSCDITGTPVFADMTVTFQAEKICHVLYPAKKHCGEVVTVDIGIPDVSMKCAGTNFFHLDEYDILLPVRDLSGHKGNYGHAVIIGGAFGMGGAAAMAAISACKSGAGLVTAVVEDSSYLQNHPEIMCRKVTKFSSDTATEIVEICKTKDVIGMGPGIGKNNETGAFVNKIIECTSCTIIVDADALHLLTESALKKLSGRAILTPHMKEFANMLGIDIHELIKNKLKYSHDFAVTHNVVLVLKSAETIISIPDDRQYLSSFGTPALSKGGSGDILTGMITALAGQCFSLPDAAAGGCYLQGCTALKASEAKENWAVTPKDIIECIGRYSS